MTLHPCLQQISTYAIISCLVSLLVKEEIGGTIFNFSLFALLYCSFIVPFSTNCTFISKWIFFFIKVCVLLICFLKHHKTLRFSYKYVLVDTLILFTYYKIMDISQVYNCKVDNNQLGITYLVSIIAYMLFAWLFRFIGAGSF